MNAVQSIRKRLGMTQAELAVGLGVSQGSVSFYENGQTVPPPIAAKLIDLAKSKGHVVTFDDVYASVAAEVDPESDTTERAA